jgi:hypothetical protein
MAADLPVNAASLAVISAAVATVLFELPPVQLGEESADELQLGLAQLVRPAAQRSLLQENSTMVMNTSISTGTKRIIVMDTKISSWTPGIMVMYTRINIIEKMCINT